ncbi:MAG TPA: hypothetical protein VEY07_02305 [Thermoplasmata archaeon]|nr:hypothetical protein [Thermoplasmata archaeon]
MLGDPPDPNGAELSDDDVLRILDELTRELGGPAPAVPRSEPIPRPVETTLPSPPPSPASILPPGQTSPYLEDRLEGARGSVRQLRDEVHEVARRAETLSGAVQSLESELGRASDELKFAREHGLLGPSTAPAASVEPKPVRIGRRAREPEGSPSRLPEGHPLASSGSPRGIRYADFTAARYNQTMTELKQRRRVVAAIALITASVVSALLVAVAFVSHGPEPPVWLEALPGIWMIPVPFFMLGFRGTHRILRRNHFDLPEVR